MIKEKSKTWAFILTKIGIWFANFPLPPNFYTWASLPTAVLGFTAIVKAHIGLGIILFIVSGLLDIIDGALARNLKKTSYFGAFLDGSLDRFVDFLLIFSYFWLLIETPWLTLGEWICIAYFFAIMPSFEVAYANHRKAVIDPEEKIIWRILNRGEMYVLMLLIPLVSTYNSQWAGYLLVTLVTLSAITTLQTFFHTLQLAVKSSRG